MKTTNFFLTLAFFLSLSLLNFNTINAQNGEAVTENSCICANAGEGTADFNFENGFVSIDGHALIIEKDAMIIQYVFNFNLAQALCTVGKGQMIEEFINESGVLETNDQKLDFLTSNDISIRLNNDYLNPKQVIRFHKYDEIEGIPVVIDLRIDIDNASGAYAMSASINKPVYQISVAMNGAGF